MGITVSRGAPVLALVLGLALGGCGAPRTPNTPAQPSSPPASPSPSATRPALSALARQDTAAGAHEFARYWFRTLSYATLTGDVAPITAASDPACTACQSAINDITVSYADGGSMSGGVFTVQSVTTDEFSKSDHPAINVVVDRSPRSSLSPFGEPRASLPGASFLPCQLLLTRTASGWIVRSVQSPSPLS